jgi:hypothetical protein
MGWLHLSASKRPSGPAHVRNERQNRRTQTQVSLQEIGPDYPLQFLQAVEPPYPFWIQPLNQQKDLRSTTSTHTVQQHPPDQRTWSDPYDARYTARYVIHSECQGHYLTSIQWWRKTLLCFCFRSKYNNIHAERLQRTRFDIRKPSYMISDILPTYRFVLHITTVLFVFIHNNFSEAPWDPIVCWHFIWFRFDRIVN